MSNIISFVKTALKHDLINGSIYLFLGFFISSFISFIFNLFLARNLSYANYGTYSSLLSIYTLATIPAASLSAVIIRFAAFYYTNGEMDKVASLYKKSLLFWAGISSGIFIFFLLISLPLGKFLNINQPLLIASISLGIALSYLGISNTAFLQALTKFKNLSLIAIVNSLSKLLVGAFLIYASFQVFGAVISIVVGVIVGLIMGFFFLRNIIYHKSESKIQLPTKEILKYGIPTSISVLLISSFISSDVILVKHFFTSAQAGFYGGLSLVGKVIFYFTGPIPMVMFPLIVKREARKEKIKPLLYLSILLVLIPSLLITLIYFIFPNFIINLFLAGRDYLTVGKYLGIFGIFLTLYSINNVLANFFLSVKRTKIVYLIALSALLQVALIFRYHANFYEIIYSSIISSLLLLISLLIYYIYQYEFHNSK